MPKNKSIRYIRTYNRFISRCLSDQDRETVARLFKESCIIDQDFDAATHYRRLERKHASRCRHNSQLIGRYVTAKLRTGIGCRQGWVISANPLIIKGEGGDEYLCKGAANLVINPPNPVIGKSYYSYYIKCRHCGNISERCVDKESMSWERFRETTLNHFGGPRMNDCESCGMQAIFDLTSIENES